MEKPSLHVVQKENLQVEMLIDSEAHLEKLREINDLTKKDVMRIIAFLMRSSHKYLLY